jgi:hypothetical protein
MKPADKKPKLVKAKRPVPTWTIVNTPGSIPSLTKELLNPNNHGAAINKIAVACDGMTIWAIVRRGDRNGTGEGGAQVMLYRSTDRGISWSDTQYSKLASIESKTENGTFVWDFALAPDNPNVIAVACADICISPLQEEIWISTDKGDHWENTHWPPHSVTAGVDFISAMDISVDFMGRKILVGTRDGTGLGTNNLQVLGIPNYGAWNTQDTKGSPPSINAVVGDIIAAKFSPKFADDCSILLVYTDGTPEHSGTWLATGVHDIPKNSTTWQAKKAHVEIKNSDSKEGSSPQISEIVTVCLELPSDFHGNTDSRRRIYISTDAVDRIENVSPNRGVYRIDNSTVYTLMDNTSTFGSITAQKMTRRVSSIAYSGTCDAGKLLVGEVLGDSTRASVQTWCTNSPTAHPVPYWFQSLKPTTGAAGQLKDPSAIYHLGYGNAQVLWSPKGAIAFVATGAASLGPFATPEAGEGVVKPQEAWPAGYVNVIPCDESAFGMSRSDGESWNQLSLINTFISKLTDVAPSADGSTIYLASVNTNGGAQRFGSVWRSSSNPRVISPLSPLPIGACWERVFTHVTAPDCSSTQTDVALLRIAGGCFEPTGQLVGWAAQGTQAQAWSPDYGDFWENITVQQPIQDFVFESSTILYNLYTDSTVHKLPYTGTSWGTNLPSVNPGLPAAHMITAMPEGQVMVGYGSASPYPVAISRDGNASWIPLLQPLAAPAPCNVHVAFDPAYATNSIIYIADDSVYGSVYRNNVAGAPLVTKWSEFDLMDVANGAMGCPRDTTVAPPVSAPHHVGQFGIALAYTGGYGQTALYSARAHVDNCTQSAVDRTLTPLSGLPKPGIAWDVLHTNLNPEVRFASEPYSLKLCGCCTIDTDTTLYTIDYRPYVPTSKIGMLWTYIDHTAKRKP